MKMIVNDRSNGRYRNELELFAEPIAEDNVKLMGEMLALKALRTAVSFDYKIMEKLYYGLIKDFHHMNEPGNAISEGYDIAQIAMCFLWQFKGRNVYEIYDTDKNGKVVTIKCACFRTLDAYIMNYRRKIAKAKQLDFFDSYRSPAVDIDYFKETDYSKADTMLEVLHLTAAETETLYCHMNGMTQSEVALYLAISIAGVKYRKMRIRQKYEMYIGKY